MPQFSERFNFIKRLGGGGMAEVFLVSMEGLEGLEHRFVMKKILPQLGRDAGFVEMFVNEARIAASLHHDNIVPIYELGEYEGSRYILMEHVDGVDLRKVINELYRRNAHMPFPMTAYVMSRVCKGLEYAHGKCDVFGHPMAIVHGDISPQNILISREGDVKIIDFGVARAQTRISDAHMKRIKGKVAYLSPEQVLGKEIDHRSDIFSVGIVLYELLTISRLFKRDSREETLKAVLEAEILPPSSVNPETPSELDDIAMKALNRDPAMRYGAARKMASDLESYEKSSSPPFTPDMVGRFLHMVMNSDAK